MSKPVGAEPFQEWRCQAPHPRRPGERCNSLLAHDFEGERLIIECQKCGNVCVLQRRIVVVEKEDS